MVHLGRVIMIQTKHLTQEVEDGPITEVEGGTILGQFLQIAQENVGKSTLDVPSSTVHISKLKPPRNV